MSICPFAEWKEITGPVGPYYSGPFRIVHHTTEGSTASGAMSAYKKNRSDPHFTVDDEKIYQHIDTALCARALRNKSGGVQTNRQSALQIEVVGFAHLPKGQATLKNVARLCRWLEATHKVELVWPNGLPKVATPDGRDPGGHNRSSKTWAAKSGHYGHSHVPENTHWDPAYTQAEVEFLMSAEFDSDGRLLNEHTQKGFFSMIPKIDLENVESTMHDHGEIDELHLY